MDDTPPMFQVENSGTEKFSFETTAVTVPQCRVVKRICVEINLIVFETSFKHFQSNKIRSDISNVHSNK